jgi:K+-transporting ATPase ATPase C chain
VRDLGGGPVPVDLVTTSASGLDPDITPAAAIFQVGRVARVRRIDSIAVAKLVRRHVQNRIWNVLGEPRVNVLRLNVGLDSLASALQSRPTQ